MTRSAIRRRGRPWARILAAALVLAVPASPRLAFAQAEALLDEGRKLMKRGKLADACPKLQESYELSPKASTLFALASCHEKQGKVATAWAEYIDVTAAARKDGNKRLEADAKFKASNLEQRLPRLTLNVPRAAAVDGLELTLDGAPIDRASWGQARPVDPGEHKVRASAPGRKGWERSVSIKRGERKAVAVPVLAKDPSAAREPAAEAPATRDEAAAPKAEAGPKAAAPAAATSSKGAAPAAAASSKGAAPAAGTPKSAAAPKTAAASSKAAVAAPDRPARGAAEGAPEDAEPPAPEGPAAGSGASSKHTGRFVVDVGVAGGVLIGVIEAGSLGNLRSYSYSYNVPDGTLIAPCDEDVCHTGFDPAIGPFAGGQVFVGVALSEDVHLGARGLGGYRFGGGYFAAGGPSGSVRLGRVWLGLTALVGGMSHNAKVTGIRGEIPAEFIDLNYGQSEVDLATHGGTLPETAPVGTLAFGGSVELSVVLADLPSSSWASGALLVSVWPTFMKGLEGFVIAAPVSLGYRFY